MSEPKRKRFESALAQLQQRFGTQVLVPARSTNPRPSTIPTGFAQLDEALGIGGVPRRFITLLSGRGTTGKVTLAYKVLSHAQWSSKRQRLQPVAILDLNASSDPDYLERCGVHLEHLLLARPQPTEDAINLLMDWLRTRPLRAILVDNLSDLTRQPHTARYLAAVLPQMQQRLAQSSCALLFVDDWQPAWQSWLQAFTPPAFQQHAAVHIELQHERWLDRAGEVYGYAARALVKRNRWGRANQSVSLAIEFGETVRARSTW